MTPRYKSLVTCILLSIVTCGIYYIYWMYCIAEDIYNSGAPDSPQVAPALQVLLCFVTCGIYPLYMYYKWGKAVQQMYNVRGWNGEDRSVLYLILAIFKLEIINMALIQDDLNRMASMPPPPTNPWQNGGGYSSAYGSGPYYNNTQSAAGQPAGTPDFSQPPPQQPYYPDGSGQGGYAPPPNSPYNP